MAKARRCVRSMREYHSPLSDPAIDLRLDMNESTTGCSPRVLTKLRNIGQEAVALYPRREPGEKMVADFLGIAADQVMLTNGADEGIDLLCRAFLEPGSDLVVVTPTFAMYEVFAQIEDANVVKVPAGAEFSFPVQRVLDALTPQTKVVIICNP